MDTLGVKPDSNPPPTVQPGRIADAEPEAAVARTVLGTSDVLAVELTEP
jgi:hypothetical protein